MNFKSLMRKVSIVLICLMMFSFCFSNVVQAKDDGIGGKLMDPVMSLLVGIGDGAITLLQKYVFGLDESMIQVSRASSFWAAFIVIATAIIVIGAIVACCLIPGLQAGGVALAVGVIKATLTVGVGIAATTFTFSTTTAIVKGALPSDFTLPIISVSPQEIFSNQIALLDVDFFNPMPDSETKDKDTGKTQIVQSTAKQLQSTIAKWYKALRDIAVVALLSILVYIGIRILISSTANDKAKYKQMIMDWVVAICLLFTMQYIMTFSNIIVNKITEVVSSMSASSKNTTNIDDSPSTNPVMYKITDEDSVSAAWKALIDDAKEKNVKTEDMPYYMYFKQQDGATQATDKSNAKVMYWPAANALAQARMELQFLNDNKQTMVSIAWKLIYVVLIVFTFVFLLTYIKRVIYMAFLTIIAPLVAMTYPIDKISDGKAQAFDMWLKEYIFNLLIQPMHLILYTILIGSAMDLAAKNVVYVIVALGFMIPAEKLLRSFFGFEKAKTPGLLAGPAGAAMMMSGMNSLLRKGPPKGGAGGKGGNGGNDKGEKENNTIKQKESLDTGEAFEPTKNSNNELNENNENNKNDNALEEEKTDQQKMVDADYENDWLDSDDNDKQFMDANARDAYGIDEQNGNMNDWDDPNLDALRDAGYIDEDLKEMFDLPDKDNNTVNTQNIEENKEDTESNDQEDLGRQVEDSNDSATVNEKKGLKNAIGKTAKFYGRGMVNKFANKGRNMHMGRKAIRMAGGAALGATTAAMGLAAGIASGDPSKTFQYTTAAALGGYKLGSGTANKVIDDLKVDGVKETFEKNYYGKEEYKERQIQKNIRMAQHDLELKQSLEDKLGKEEAKKYMSEAVPEYTRYGISDKKTIVAMAQMEKAGMDRKKAMSAALISDKYLKGKDSTSLGKKEEDEFKKTIKRDGEKRNLKGDSLDKFERAQLEAIHKLDEMRFK